MKIIKKLLGGIVRSVFDYAMLPHMYEQNEIILRGVARLNTIAHLHQQTFAGFKNCHRGRDIVIIGAGPSVSKFKPIPNAIYIGLNRACMLDSAKFDYLFTIDKLGVDKIYKEFAAVNCLKFVGDQNLGVAFQIPESEIAKMNNVKQYKTDAGLFSQSCFAIDLESEPLGNFNTVSLQALQFALYTNPRRIFLVGIDCSTAGHFNNKQDTKGEHRKRSKERGEDLNVWANETVQFWAKAKNFANIYYPDTEVISVNPVGLRGLFKDLDQ